MRMHSLWLPMAIAGSALAACSPRDATPALPLADGEYTFAHRHAEHPKLPSITVQVTIERGRVTVRNVTANPVIPLGVMEKGQLRWHTPSGRWVIMHQESDLLAPEVGGCSDGPSTIDLEQRIFWTC